jgi:hypothetical protein
LVSIVRQAIAARDRAGVTHGEALDHDVGLRAIAIKNEAIGRSLKWMRLGFAGVKA